MNAEVFATVFFRNIVKLHRFPVNIISDRGSLFLSEFWRTLMELCQIKPKLSTSFHPQTDGQTERANQTMEQYLQTYCSYEQDDWSELLPMAEFVCNNSKSASTGVTPFEANYGFKPWSQILDLESSTSLRGKSYAIQIQEIQTQL